MKDFTGANDQQIKVELWNNLAIPGMNKPGQQLGSFTVPAPNDGTAAAFVCPLPATVNLVSGTIYWLFVYGVLTDTAMLRGVTASWLAGDIPQGAATITEALVYGSGSYEPSNAKPAFSLLVTV